MNASRAYWLAASVAQHDGRPRQAVRMPLISCSSKKEGLLKYVLEPLKELVDSLPCGAFSIVVVAHACHC